MYDLHVLLDELTILRQENEQLKGYLLEMSPDAVIAVDRDGKIVSVNQHAEQLFGYDRQELLGQAMEILIPEQYRDVHHSHRNVYSKSPHFRPMGKTSLEFYALRKDGTVFSADINLNPVQRSGIVLAAIRDISQRKQLEQSLREAKEQAEAAARAKSIFLAGMTHEFRTPLNGILGFIQLLEQSPTLTADQQKYLAAIQRSGEHLLDIITDVLHMARIETGRIQLQPQVFDLHRFLYELETRTRTRAQLKHLQVIVDISANLPRLVEGDAEKLRQILLNLLGNAVKFTVSGKVTLRVGWQGETAEFEVEDTGPGIAPEALLQIFEPFVQCKAGDVVIEGTGLGLAICQKFVELLGGTIQVKSQVGVGSTFRFVIPLQVKESADEESSQANLTPTLINYGAPIRLLVVDDQSDDRELLRMLLSRDGFDVRVAANGHEAVSYWQEWFPHLVWMNMRMPVMDGYEATQKIRQLEELYPPTAPNRVFSTKIIALTANVLDDVRHEILAAGCDDVVTKPYKLQTLLEKIHFHLGIRHLFEPLASPIASETPSLTDQLGQMDGEWKTALYQMLIAGDIIRAVEIAQQVSPTHPELAQELTDMVNNYQFEPLLAILEED